MSLTTVSNGSTINASDINQLVNILHQPAGNSETGIYYFEEPGYTTGAMVMMYIMTRSRGTTPVSCSFDTSLGSPTGMNTPTTDLLTSGGFRLQSTTTAAQTNPGASGTWTVNF